MHRSELRQDLVSGDWIAVAPRRGARPHQLLDRRRRIRAPKRGCPFEMPSPRRAFLTYGSGTRWRVAVVPNKFPAFTHRAVCPAFVREGIYTVTEAAGHHDIILTRGHDRNFSDLAPDDARAVFQAFRDRYLMMAEDRCVFYVAMFQNWGPQAGASIYHPHYQMIGIPVVPPDVEHSFAGSRAFFRKHQRCVHCEMIAYERKARRRIVAENRLAVAIAPFASRAAFEMRVFPKVHLPFFEDSVDHHVDGVVEVLQGALKAMQRALRDPDYNFFIHTSPLRNRSRYGHYHWHIEVLPKLSMFAGFELGTGLEINTVDPAKAARILRAAFRRRVPIR